MPADLGLTREETEGGEDNEVSHTRDARLVTLARLGGLVVCLLLFLVCRESPAEEPARPPSDAEIGADAPPSRVLVLYSERANLPAVVDIDRGLRSTLNADGRSIELFAEYLDVARFPSERQIERYSDSLRHRYAELKPDVVIAVGGLSLDFLLRFGGGLYPGTPIVLGVVERRHVRAGPLPPNVTGVTMTVQTRTTLALALQLHPGTRRVLVVAGMAELDRYWARETIRAVRDLAPAAEIFDLGELPMARMLEAVASQPRHTVIFYVHVRRDAAGQRFTPREALARIATVANAPIYGAYETYVGHGIVGGHVLRFEPQGVRAAQVALRVLSGERADDIPAEEYDSNAYVFDARQLARFGVDEGQLPAGSVVRFREPPVWRRYRWPIAIAGGLLVAQTAFIAGLLVHRGRRRRAERALAERLRFEALLSELSATFITAPARALDEEITRALRWIGEELNVDRATIVELGDDPDVIDIPFAWHRALIERVPSRVARASYPWMRAQVLDRKVVRFSRPEELPDEAAVDRASLAALGTRSAAVLPLAIEGRVVAALSFASVRFERDWPDDVIQRLRLLEESFAYALARRRADSAIRESEERFTLMADSAPVMVWLSTPDARRTYFNTRWREFTGRPVADEEGDGWLAGVDAEDRDRCRALLAAAHRARRPVTIEYRLLGADGAPRWVLDHGVPRIAPDGGFSGFVGSCIDVSELRRAQQAVVEADQLRSAIFGALYGHVAALDKDGVIIAVNQSWVDLAMHHGIDAGRVSVGARYVDACRAAAAMTDADGRQAVSMIAGALGVPGTASRLEYASASGERWFEMTVEPLRRPEGGAVVSHVDITRRRQAEEAARRQADDLAHALRVGTLGDLAGVLAHEINQPLAAIVANAQATIRVLERAGRDDPNVVSALRDIASDGKRASQVIRRLRTLFRKEHAVRVPVHVDSLVDEVVQLLEGEMRRKRIAVRWSVPTALPPVLGDTVQLQQVLLNVLLNAAEAVAAAGDDRREIDIAIGRGEPDVIAVTVSDTGIGVKEADLERIFERFVSGKAEGLGMGLPISRSIVQAHGGRIWAERNAERGLTVHIELACEEKAGRA